MSCPTRRMGDVELLVSELATNSVRHSGCDEDAEISMMAAVKDGLRARAPVRRRRRLRRAARPQPRPERGGGYGLVLLDRLADRWGVVRDDGFCVWFEVDASLAA